MRQFIGRDGTSWDLYEVTSESLGARFPDVLPPAYRNGWLVFESASERRRLAPVPGEWVLFPLDALQLLLERAEPVEHRDNHHRIRSFGSTDEQSTLT